MSEHRMLIGGKMVEGAGAIDVINPATGAAFARCPIADEAQLDEAVAAARAAFPAWAATAIDHRAELLEELTSALNENADAIARVLTQEQGKPITEAKGEVASAAYTLRTFSKMRIDPKVLRNDDKARITEIRKPLGVVAAILPWNFPVSLIANKLGPALISGNTVVLKPAPTTPLSTLMVADLCAKIFPPGVVNVICDNNDLGGLLCAHPGVDKVTFTGSTATGRKVLAASAATLKRVTLELGGNDAAIVLDDADPKETARKIFGAAMGNAGQVCIAVKRAYVPSSLYDEFCGELAELADAAVVDDGTKQGAQIGPVQNRNQFEKLKDLLDRKEGTVIAGGAPIDREGYFIHPTIVRDVNEDARIVREEQFGPILPVLKYDDIEDVLARANDTEYGLGGSVWGKDLNRAVQVAERIQSGTVWVNQHRMLNPKIPFRGAKSSGIGTELSEEGVFEYTQPTVINVAMS